jgi:hypothetical protein
MEAIWEDLSSEDQSIQSPAWHESLLQETEQRVQSGQEKILDWKEAKKELRKRFGTGIIPFFMQKFTYVTECGAYQGSEGWITN